MIICKLNITVIHIAKSRLSNMSKPRWSRGRWELSWEFPTGLTKDEVRVEESRCGRTSQQYCSLLMVSHSQAQHTGLFRCRYRHRTQKQTSVYVYVTGKKILLPEVGSRSFTL